MLRRILRYARLHGFRALPAKAVEYWRQHTAPLVILCTPLSKVRHADPDTQRYQEISQVPQETLEAIQQLGVAGAVTQTLETRFAKGGTLWVLYRDSRPSAFAWSSWGTTLERHFWPLASDDLRIVDVFVFEKFRGRHLAPILISTMLEHCRRDQQNGHGVAEVRVWNTPMLRALRKIDFEQLCAVHRSVFLPHRTLVLWSEPPRGAG